jgi:hypothetical protein
VGNAEKRNRTNTIVVDTTNGKNPDDLSTLLRTLGVTSVVSMPVDEQTSTAQFKRAPKDAAVIPFPIPDNTPPVTTTYFVFLLLICLDIIHPKRVSGKLDVAML